MLLNLIKEIFEICIIPMLGTLTIFFVQWIRAKSQSLKAKTDNELHTKYMDMVTETICQCILATEQTYVSSLKASNSFDKEAQQTAFKMTYDAILNILNDDVKKYLNSVVGDIKIYLTEKIESEILLNK